MGAIDLEKLRSINFGGKTRDQSRVRAHKSDDDGHITGYEIDYHDGRVEAVVRPGPVNVTESISTGAVRVG